MFPPKTWLLQFSARSFSIRHLDTLSTFWDLEFWKDLGMIFHDFPIRNYFSFSWSPRLRDFEESGLCHESGAKVNRNLFRRLKILDPRLTTTRPYDEARCPVCWEGQKEKRRALTMCQSEVAVGYCWIIPWALPGQKCAPVSWALALGLSGLKDVRSKGQMCDCSHLAGKDIKFYHILLVRIWFLL